MDAEKERYDKLHDALFGHQPIPDLSGHKLCIHPMHDDLRRLIDGPGVDLELAFNSGDVIASDDPAAIAYEQRYDRKVAEYKEKIAIMEEIEAFEGRDGPKYH